jgi:hypothetical protein
MLLLAAGGGCADSEGGLLPVGGAEASVVAETHYLRRLHLDLTGNPPSDADLKAALGRLEKEGNSAKTRGALADELLAKDSFAVLFVGELENRVFAGQSADYAYEFVCSIFKAQDMACASCKEDDPCLCKCPAIDGLAEEREAIKAAPAKLTSGEETTGGVERLYAGSKVVQSFGGSAEGIAMTLWENFLGREIEPDEQRNARFLIIGSLVPGSPAGLLFHRHGEDYADLIDIVFSSEVYREAAAGGVFQRYLGRPPSPDELVFFTSGLDAAKPDVRGVIRAVVSSGEYFAQ